LKQTKERNAAYLQMFRLLSGLEPSPHASVRRVQLLIRTCIFGDQTRVASGILSKVAFVDETAMLGCRDDLLDLLESDSGVRVLARTPTLIQGKHRISNHG
jgi:hypothetical protein